MTRTAFLFPGQGAQTVGMGRQMAETHPAARDLFQRADALLGYPLARLCFEGPAEALDSTVHSQPALFVTSLAALEVLKSSQAEAVERCEATAGLSLGEYTALVFAGAMSFEDGLKVVQRRGEAMQLASDRVSSGMVSILGLDADAVRRLCDACRAPGEVLEVANYLCPGNIVISGSRAACERAADESVAAGAMKAIPLAVAGAFHTELMRPAVDSLLEVLAHVPLSRPRIAVVSNVDARVHEDPDEIRQLLVRQVVSPVLWEGSMKALIERGIDDFYEIGTGRVLKGLLRRIDRKIACENIEC